jgi:hypothetical protein
VGGLILAGLLVPRCCAAWMWSAGVARFDAIEKERVALRCAEVLRSQ